MHTVLLRMHGICPSFIRSLLVVFAWTGAASLERSMLELEHGHERIQQHNGSFFIGFHHTWPFGGDSFTIRINHGTPATFPYYSIFLRHLFNQTSILSLRRHHCTSATNPFFCIDLLWVMKGSEGWQDHTLEAEEERWRDGKSQVLPTRGAILRIVA